MPNFTITIENTETATANMQVRLIVYNPQGVSATEKNDTAQYVLQSASGEKILNVLKEDASLLTLSPGGSTIFAGQSNFNTPEQSLTIKEKQVLKLLSKGYSYKMIAEELQKSVETIRVQIKSIYKKLQVCSNTQAILKAISSGLL